MRGVKPLGRSDRRLRNIGVLAAVTTAYSVLAAVTTAYSC